MTTDETEKAPGQVEVVDCGLQRGANRAPPDCAVRRANSRKLLKRRLAVVSGKQSHCRAVAQRRGPPSLGSPADFPPGRGRRLSAEESRRAPVHSKARPAVSGASPVARSGEPALLSSRSARAPDRRLRSAGGVAPREIFALRWGDVDKGYAVIRRRVYRGEIDTPKTTNSQRWAAFGDALTIWLRNWRAILPKSGPEDWLFPSERDTPLRKDNCWRRHFAPRLQSVKLE